MALKPKEFGVLAASGRFTVFHYPAHDDDVLERGYFNTLWQRMRPGDLIVVSAKGPRTMLLTVGKSSRDGVLVAEMGSEPVPAAAKPTPKTTTQKGKEKDDGAQEPK